MFAARDASETTRSITVFAAVWQMSTTAARRARTGSALVAAPILSSDLRRLELQAGRERAVLRVDADHRRRLEELLVRDTEAAKHFGAVGHREPTVVHHARGVRD